MFVIQDEDEEPGALVNPLIADRSDETEPDEGCLSMQGVVVGVDAAARADRGRDERRASRLELGELQRSHTSSTTSTAS